MENQALNPRLTGLDAAFLYVEQESAPMHIGGVTVIDGDLSLEDFQEMLDAKLQFIPRYMQRIMVPPMHVGHPVWGDDPHFDISSHVLEAKIPSPGKDYQLMRLAGKLFEGKLDRDRPLWKVYVVRGLEGGRTGLIWLVHHCMVDGVSGAELLTITFDTSPNPKPPPKKPHPPAEPPDENTLILDSIWDNITEQVESWAELQKNAVHLMRNLRGLHSFTLMRELPALMRDLAVPIRKLPFNTYKLSGKRKLAWTDVSFTEARAIRSEVGGTVNDVVLASLAEGVKKYLDIHGVSTRRLDLRVMVPVSVRAEHERGAMGNRVSLVPIDIPLGYRDPIRRMRAITERMSLLKRAKVADIVNLGSQLWQGTVPPFQAALGQTLFSPCMQNVLGVAAQTPGMHMVCTNVPGPMIPLYVCGQPVQAHYPLLPVAPGMGLNMGVFSYNHRLHFGFIADTNAAPDVKKFCQLVEDSFYELREAAGVPESEAIKLKSQNNAPVPRGNGSNGNGHKGKARAKSKRKAKAKTKGDAS